MSCSKCSITLFSGKKVRRQFKERSHHTRPVSLFDAGIRGKISEKWGQSRLSRSLVGTLPHSPSNAARRKSSCSTAVLVPAIRCAGPARAGGLHAGLGTIPGQEREQGR